MARQAGLAISNNFSGGFITETTSLNFPENSVTEAENVTFGLKGNVHRRLGIDLEANFSLKDQDRTSGVVNNYIWKDASGDGSLTILVQQVGNTLFFYKASASDTLSNNPISDTVDLTQFSPNDAPSPALTRCEFSTGLGKLFVTHPFLESFYIEYDPATETFSTTEIALMIRDFEGVPTTLELNERPSSLSVTHHYNLLNQGWSTSSQTYTSTTLQNYVSTAIGNDYVWNIASGQTIATDEPMNCYISFDLSRFYTGHVVSYSGTTLTIRIRAWNGGDTYTGSGPWIFAREAPYLQIWNQQLANYPSNADVWWYYKNSNDIFDAVSAARINTGNRPARKGHFILDVYNQDRNTASGLTSLPVTNTGPNRASTSAFFAGRLFLSGIKYTGFGSKIYFTQIIEDKEQYSKFYQVNDPTSEDFYDILPTDGGVIDIQEAGQILKLFAIKEGLLVFASNGIWFISGSTGLGFTATDYSIQKIANISTVSTVSFVDFNGTPVWWNNDGIYAISFGERGELGVQSLTERKIKDFYTEIPISSRRNAKGAFNVLTGIIQWLYRSTSAGTVEENEEYDRILNYDTRTGAFYVWSISNSDYKVNSIFVVESTGGAVTELQVVDNSGNDVIDQAGNLVVVYDLISGGATPVFKYTISAVNGGTYNFSFAEERSESYLDWSSTATPVDYKSSFTTGYRLDGQTQKKFQTNYVYLFSDGEEDTQFHFQAIRDFTTSGNSGKWGSKQLITNTPVDRQTVYKRIKVRGHGIALQYHVESLTGQPFNIIGWSTLITMNQTP